MGSGGADERWGTGGAREARGRRRGGARRALAGAGPLAAQGGGGWWAPALRQRGSWGRARRAGCGARRAPAGAGAAPGPLVRCRLPRGGRWRRPPSPAEVGLR